MKQAAIIMALASLACAGVAPAVHAQNKVFALVPKNMNNPFFDQARDGCQKAAAEIGGIECYYIGPGEHGGGDEQFQMVQDLIAKKVDGLAVSVANAPAIAKAAAAAKAAGIPLVTWDSDLLDQDHGLRATYIGTVNTEIGKEIAKRAMALKPDGGTFCIQSGGPSAVNMNERMKGMLETLPADKWKQVDGCPLYNNDDFPLSIVQMTDILAKYPELDAMLNAGGAPQMLPQAYRQLLANYQDRIKNDDHHPHARLREHRRLGGAPFNGRHLGDGRIVRPDRRRRASRRRCRHRRCARAAQRDAGDRRGRRLYRLALHRHRRRRASAPAQSSPRTSR